MSSENSPYAPTPELIVKTVRSMFLARIFEEKISALYRAGKIVGGVYVGTGQEAFSAALGQQLDQSRGDLYAPLIRDQAGRLGYGEPLHDAARTYLGSVEGPMRGRDGNIHRGRPKEGMPAMISHLGTSVSVINGMMMAKRFQGKSGFVGAASSGDGMTSTGAFHEALNQAAVEKLPLVVALANNQFAYSTPTSRQFACENLVDRAAGYGIRGYSVNGTDVIACLEAFAEAIDRALNGEGPQLVVGKLLRLSGHGVHDDASYVPDDLKGGEYGRDGVILARKMVLEKGLLTEAELSDLEEELTEVVEKVVAEAQGEDSPNPATESWAALSTSELTERMF